jgi:4-diphosphocytidyl-2-C-methyl-D-erythritol kinase
MDARISRPVEHRFQRLHGGGLRVYAPAKINLNLLVGPLRPDRYHPVDSFVCHVSLYDRFEIRPSSNPKLQISCTGWDCGEERSNLALRAAYAMRNAFARSKSVIISLHKEIPAGRGLGGGSSDAAAMVSALARLWRLDVPFEQLMKIGERLGSDVPLFLGPPCARMTGRGEVLEPATVHDFHAVVVLCKALCRTPDVYRAFDQHPQEMGPQLDAAVLKDPPSTWRDKLVNQLSQAARTVSPALADVWDTLSKALDEPVCLTGSGSALFVLADDQQQAIDIFGRMPPALQELAVIVSANRW